MAVGAELIRIEVEGAGNLKPSRCGHRTGSGACWLPAPGVRRSPAPAPSARQRLHPHPPTPAPAALNARAGTRARAAREAGERPHRLARAAPPRVGTRHRPAVRCTASGTGRPHRAGTTSTPSSPATPACSGAPQQPAAVQPSARAPRRRGHAHHRRAPQRSRRSTPGVEAPHPALHLRRGDRRHRARAPARRAERTLGRRAPARSPLLPLLVRAVVLAAQRQFPQVNARFDDEAGVRHAPRRGASGRRHPDRRPA